MTHLVAADGGEGVDNGVLCAAAAAGRLLHGRFHGERGGSGGGGRRRFALCVAEHVLSLALEEMDMYMLMGGARLRSLLCQLKMREGFRMG